MLGAPGAKRGQCFCQRSAECREGIFNLRRYLIVVEPVDDSVRVQFLELLDEHLVADAPNGAPQLTIATRAVREVKQYQRLPLPTDYGQGGIQAAGKRNRGHAWDSTGTYQKVHTSIVVSDVLACPTVVMLLGDSDGQA